MFRDTRLSIAIALSVVLFALKHFGVIDWSWWWVITPLMVEGAIGLVFLVVVGLFIFLDSRKARR